MALFSRGDKDKPAASAPSSQARPVVGRNAFCRICGKVQSFSRCWLRIGPITGCPCCGAAFPDPAALYRRTLPACPRCEEYLEQPGFEYGLCDGCGSKFEIVSNCRPSLLPNKAQRDAMSKYGKAWRRD